MGCAVSEDCSIQWGSTRSAGGVRRPAWLSPACGHWPARGGDVPSWPVLTTRLPTRAVASPTRTQGLAVASSANQRLGVMSARLGGGAAGAQVAGCSLRVSVNGHRWRWVRSGGARLEVGWCRAECGWGLFEGGEFGADSAARPG